MMPKNICIGILSAPGNRAQREAIRATWMKDARRLGVPAFFLVGDKNGIRPVAKNDMLILPMEDSYERLPQKTSLFLRWGIEMTSHEWFFKCDDDTYVDVQKLISFPTEGADYIGNPCAPHVASGGAGYILSRKAAHVVANRMLAKTGAEDVEVGRVLFENSIPLIPTDRFDPAHGKRNHRIPTKQNEIITTHYIDPERMLQIWTSQES